MFCIFSFLNGKYNVMTCKSKIHWNTPVLQVWRSAQNRHHEILLLLEDTCGVNTSASEYTLTISIEQEI